MKLFTITYFLFIFSFLTFFASGFVDSQDGFQYLAVARRLYFDHTAELPKETYADEQNIHLSTNKGNEGKLYSPTGLGYSLALLPAVFMEDIFLRLSHLSPISAFPLQSDWPVLLFASFSNSFFAALLAVTIFFYLKSFQIPTKTSLFLSLLSIIGTNLFPYSKYSFAHMMFVTFLVLTFYFFRMNAIKNKALMLFFAGLSFGVVIIAYNPSYILPIPALALYYLLLNIKEVKSRNFRFIMKNFLSFLLGILPFLTIYYLFNHIRFGSGSESGYGIVALPERPPVYLIFEGIWGVFLSPGKSIFLFSPILLTVFLFWFKIKKDILPELISFLTLTLIYVYFIGTLLGYVELPGWHGESSYGPRYMLPILPFWMIIIGNIYVRLTSNNKKFVFFPLIVIGIMIQLVGILLPYQIKFAGLQVDNYLNERNFNVYEYGNEIPRYSPVLTLSKTLAKRILYLNKTYDHGPYNLRLYDGFNYPFDLGWTKWRGILPLAFISFDNSSKKPLSKIDLQFRNHQIDQNSSFSAQLSFSINGKKQSDDLVIPINEEKGITFTPDQLNAKNNRLSIHTKFIGTASAQLKDKQAIFLQFIKLNDQLGNMETLDYPIVSPISEKLFGAEYSYWGNVEKDPWPIWHERTRVYEQTFDLWWLRPLNFWDLPKKFFYSLLAINIFSITFFGYQLFQGLKLKNFNKHN